MSNEGLIRPRLPDSEVVADRPDDALGDLRFRKLLTAEAWRSLSPPVRRRFSKRLAPGATIVYAGTITEIEFSRLGWALAQVLRILGGPLPCSKDAGAASVVTVTEDHRHGGQIWTRLYARRSGFPQIIHSTKRFEGRSGLEEHVGRGIGMSLSVSAEESALVFRSKRYFIAIGDRRVHLPRWLTPGALTVRHIEIDAHRFAFTLDLDHGVFGRLVHQRGEFCDGHD